MTLGRSANGENAFALLMRQAFEVLGVATPERHQFFFTPLGITSAARRAFVEGCLDPTRLASPEIRTPAIPRVIHRIWLTDPKAPRLPPERFVARIAQQMAELGETWVCMFWSNSEVVGRHVAAAGAARVQLLDISVLADDPLHARIALAVEARKYVLAGDILKYLLIARFGGIYADLGVDFREKMMDAVMASDISLYLSHDLFFQPAFMAAPPLSQPMQLFRLLLLRPEILTALCLDFASQNLAAAEIWTHGGLGFTAALMLFFDRTYRLLPVAPAPGLLQVESLRSWYGDADSFGGVKLDAAPVTHIDVAQCVALASRFETLRYSGAATTAARLKLIAGLADAYAIDV